MFRAIAVLCLVSLSLQTSASLSRQKRIVGGQPANPPPAGASEAEDVVENPALAEVQPVKPPVSNSISTSTTRRPAANDDGGPIVFVRRGRREARVKGAKEQDGVYAFKGIRYAEPPVGSMRFQRPRRTKLEGEVQATNMGPPCPQTIGQRVVGSEDCLFLNVFSPELPKDKTGQKYPVIFWIHGGGFRRGSGSQYGVADLVKKGLVVVTIQYRLGSLGFLSTNKKELPGNAGLFDIATSLRWVRQYIQFFGGDPGRIIPSGQGSGASAAVMLSLARFAQNWVKGVFAMSGTALSSFAVDEEPARTAHEAAAVNDCQAITESLEFVRCMQKLPVETVLKGDDKVQVGRLDDSNPTQSYITSISKLLNPGPAVEGEDDFRFLPNFLTGTPQETLQRGDFAKVPLLTGVTKDETSTSAKGGGIASQILGQVEATEEMIQNLIPQLLSVNSGIFGNTSLNPLVGQLVSKNSDYMKGITSSLNGVTDTIDKVIQLTTDALFNLPAFLTSQYWSKHSKAYLYSFEHETRTTAADDFLQESPLTNQAGDKHVEGVGHGDDLIYLFDLWTLDGRAMDAGALSSPDDLKMRDEFTSLVAEFARTGEPKIGGQSIKPFTAENGDYMIVKPTSSQASGFRKCQMGLWAGLSDVLKSAECSFLQLGDLVNNLGLGQLNVTKGATDALIKPTSNLANNLNNRTSGLTGGLTGLLGGNRNKGTTAKPFLGLG